MDVESNAAKAAKDAAPANDPPAMSVPYVIRDRHELPTHIPVKHPSAAAASPLVDSRVAEDPKTGKPRVDECQTDEDRACAGTSQKQAIPPVVPTVPEAVSEAPITSVERPSTFASKQPLSTPVDMSGPANEDLGLAFTFTNDIIDKQYRSYVWNDGKVQALVTIDTALIAGILLILQLFPHISTFGFVVLASAFLFFLSSFLVCLIHAVPRIHSGIGQSGNLRTMVGISKHNKHTYHEAIAGINLHDVLRMNCWQIVGMCTNNLRSHKLITWGVALTLAGVLVLGIAISEIAFADWSARSQPTSQQQQLIQTVPHPDAVMVPEQTPALTSGDQARHSIRETPSGSEKNNQTERNTNTKKR